MKILDIIKIQEEQHYPFKKAKWTNYTIDKFLNDTFTNINKNKTKNDWIVYWDSLTGVK